MSSRLKLFLNRLFLGAFVGFSILVMIATWKAYQRNAALVAEIADLRGQLATSQQNIKTYENQRTRFNKVRLENKDLARDIKTLNRIATTLDQFVVADPEQIITQSTGNLGSGFRWGYRGYVPNGTYTLDLGIYQSALEIDPNKMSPKHNVKFELKGPTKFEIECVGDKRPHKLLEVALKVPEHEIEKRTIHFARPFSIGGRGSRHNWRDGLPTYPNELDIEASALRKFRRGVRLGDHQHTFQTIYSKTEVGHLAVVATIHSDASYCLKAGNTAANRFYAKRSLGMLFNEEKQLLEYLSPDTEVPSRLLVNVILDQTLKQLPLPKPDKALNEKTSNSNERRE